MAADAPSATTRCRVAKREERPSPDLAPKTGVNIGFKPPSGTLTAGDLPPLRSVAVRARRVRSTENRATSPSVSAQPVLAGFYDGTRPPRVLISAMTASTPAFKPSVAAAARLGLEPQRQSRTTRSAHVGRRSVVENWASVSHFPQSTRAPLLLDLDALAVLALLVGDRGQADKSRLLQKASRKGPLRGDGKAGFSTRGSSFSAACGRSRLRRQERSRGNVSTMLGFLLLAGRTSDPTPSERQGQARAFH